MYYIPDGTERCGFYECDDCGTRFLDLKTVPRIICPYCGEEQDMEIGPDEYASQARDTYISERNGTERSISYIRA